MKRIKQKFSLKNISNFFTNNVAIIVILLILASLMALMNVNGFKITYKQLERNPSSMKLIQDRIPLLAGYYNRKRIPITIILADEAELDEGEVLHPIEAEARYNQNSILSEFFSNNTGRVPLRENYLFTHYSKVPNGEPINPGERITEPGTTFYANWIPKPEVGESEVLVRISLLAEYGINTYSPAKYQYEVLNKGEKAAVELETLNGYIIKKDRPIDKPDEKPEDYFVEITVAQAEIRPIIDYSFPFDNLTKKKLTYNLNGGELIASTQLLTYNIAQHGNIASSPNVKHATKRFVGWSFVEDGEVISLQDVSMYDDITLYAIYEDFLPVPEKGTNQGRYMSNYHVESIFQSGVYVLLKQVDNIGTIGTEVSVENLDNENFELITFDDYIYEERIFQGQFLIVPKKDKSARLNNLIISYTEFNWIGVVMLLIIFVTLMWVFIDNSSKKTKFIMWAALLLIATVILFLLPTMINFSSYLEYLLSVSKEVDPAATTITTLNGVKFAGVFLILAAVFSILTFVLALLNDKFEKKVLPSEELEE